MGGKFDTRNFTVSDIINQKGKKTYPFLFK